MIYEIFALNDVNYRINYEIPTTTITGRREGWRYLSELWNEMCIFRGSKTVLGQFVQFTFLNKKSTIGRTHDSHFTRKSNIAHFIATMIEFCNLYVPIDIGRDALEAIYNRYDLFLLDTATDSKYRVYSEEDNALFSVTTERVDPFMSAVMYLDKMCKQNKDPYRAGYFETMRYCYNIIECSRSVHPYQVLLPIFKVHPDVVAAFVRQNHMVSTSAMAYHTPLMYTVGYASAYMTIEMFHRAIYDQASLASNPPEIKSFWDALDGFTSDPRYIGSYAKFFETARTFIRSHYKR